MNKHILIPGFCLLFLIAAQGNAADTISTLEAKLKDARGEEQLKIVIELTDLYTEKDLEKAFSYAKKALELVQRTQTSREAEVLNLLGKISYRRGDYTSTIDYANQASAIARKLEDKKNDAASLFNLGMANKYLANYNQALDYFSSAQAIYKELGDKKKIVTCLNQIGLVYRRVNDFSKALEYLMKAGEICIQSNDKNALASIYNNIGIIYFEMGNLDFAIEYYKKNLEISQENDTPGNIGIYKMNIAEIYDRQGKYDEAIKLYKESLEIAEKVGSPKNLSNALLSMGDHFEKRNDPRNALDYYTRALKIKEGIHESYGIIEALLGLGRIHHRLGHYPAARDFLEKTITLSKEINNPMGIRDAYSQLSAVYQETGDYPKALEYYKKYKETNDTIFNEDNARKIAEMQARFDLERKEKEISLLKKDQQIQSLKLVRQKSIIYSSIVISVLILILAFVIYTRYRLKARANKKLQEEISIRIKTEEALVKSRKLETIAILAGGISHDFNNLLTVILGNLSFIKDSDLPLDDTVVHCLDSAEKAANNAADLIRKFLAISNAKGGQPKKVILPDILKNISSFSHQFEQIRLDISIPGNLKPIYGDEHQLVQLMGNLLLNAYEAAGPAGDVEGNNFDKPIGITVSAQNIMLENENPWNLQPGEYIKVSVKDRGKGIPPELMDKIFDPYFSTKQRGIQKGMGFGLAIASAIMKKHKGHIEVSSEVNQGTTVDLYIPAYND